MPYILAVRRACVTCALIVVAQHSAGAGGLVVTNGSPRSIGRAGTGTVGDDGGGALLVNPAAMARREGYRAEVGVAFIDDEIVWQSGTPEAPAARDQAPSSIAPLVAGIGSVGSWVIGIGAMTSAVSDRSLRRPGALPTEELGVAFDYRYAGIAGAVRRDTITIGAARRIGDSIALGVALGGSRVQLTEVRRMWAGFSGRDVIGAPQQDLELGFSGSDRFVASGVVGVLVAPAESPLELGASVAWSQSSRIAADVVAVGTPPLGPSISSDHASATLDIQQPVTARIGGRYLGERLVAELGGEVAFLPASASSTAWTVQGMRVIDRTGVAAALTTVPSRVSLRTHGAVRAAVDVELIGGFLWATGGYAYSLASVDRRDQSPSFGDLGGHTLGLGLEGTAGGCTVTFGWSRTWATEHATTSRLQLDNPFGAGDRSVPSGVYDGSVDQLGILVDVELDTKP
jgi:hypothetical protein